jgi:hypothetical protein
MNVYFDNNNEEIPFFSLAEFFPIAAGLLGYTQQTATLALTGNVLTVTMPNGETALLDFDAGTMTIPHREGFLASLGRTSALDILSASGFVSADNKVCYVEDLDSSSYNQGNTVVIDLKAYQIPMILDNGVGYLPLQTFSDFILNPIGLAFYYNGQTLYLATGSLGDMKDSYYSAKTGNRSATLADFTYRELCLNLDSNYGLKAEHKITTFDDYFTRTGRKADLLSTDPQKADAALAYVLANDLDDGHSKSVGPSYLSGADFDVRNSKYNGVSNLAWDSTSSTFTAAREKALGKTISHYEVVGDTAFITFDEFTVSGNWGSSGPAFCWYPLCARRMRRMTYPLTEKQKEIVDYSDGHGLEEAEARFGISHNQVRYLREKRNRIEREKNPGNSEAVRPAMAFARVECGERTIEVRIGTVAMTITASDLAEVMRRL